MYRIYMIILCTFLFTMGVKAQEVNIDNVVIILDSSGSMNSNMRDTDIQKLFAAKTAIKEVISTIPQSTQIGVLVFGGNVNDWLYPLGIRDDKKILQAIDEISAYGGTPLGEYLKKGADRLLEARRSQYGYGSYRLLIVTDGEADDAHLVNTYTADIISRGIIADVIGVDMAVDHTLATKVHSYRRANDPASLKKAIQEVFAEVGKTTDDQTQIDAFKELSGISTEIAKGIISAYAASENEPIQAKTIKVDYERNSQKRTNYQNQPNKTNVSNQRKGKSKSSSVFIILIVMIIIFSKILRKKK